MNANDPLYASNDPADESVVDAVWTYQRPQPWTETELAALAFLVAMEEDDPAGGPSARGA